jgi:hypothetical protein
LSTRDTEAIDAWGRHADGPARDGAVGRGFDHEPGLLSCGNRFPYGKRFPVCKLTRFARDLKGSFLYCYASVTPRIGLVLV